MQTGIIVWDKDHRLLFSNESMKLVQSEIGFEFEPGVSRYDMLKNQEEKNASPVPKGKSIEEWIEESMELMRKNPEGLQGEINVNEKTLLYSVKLLADGSYIQSYADITELRKKEKELLRLQEGLEQMGTGMAFWDKEDMLIYANKNLRDFQADIGFDLKHGVSRIDMIKNQIEKRAMNYGSTSAEKVHRDFMKRIDEASKNGEGASIEFETKIKGEQIFAMVTGFRLKSGDWIQTVSNITELRKREQDLSRIYNGIDALSNATILWDADDKVAFFNKAAKNVQKSFGLDLVVGLPRKTLVENSLRTGLFELAPKQTVQQYIQQVDYLDSRFSERTNNLMENYQSLITGLSEKLLLLNPGRELFSQKHGIEVLNSRLMLAIRHLHEKLEDSIKRQTDLLKSLSPLSVLHRGYSVAVDKSGNLLRSVKDVQSGEKLEVRLEDGTLKTKITSVKPQ